MELRERFALSPFIDIDIDVGGEGRVGIVHGDDELRTDVTAALVARRLPMRLSTEP
jgi:hypothetical protein